MSEKPILFTSEMVRAILDGRKTQTRRIIKPQPYKSDRNPPNYSDIAVGDLFICPDYFPTEENAGRVIVECESRGTYHCMGVEAFVSKHCPYGKVGDTLWVRETWRCTGGGDLRNIIYQAEGDSALSFCGIDDGRVGILHVTGPHWAEWDRLVYKTDRGCNWRSPIHMFRWAARIFLEITNIRVERVQDITLADIKAEGLSIERKFEETTDAWIKLWDSINAKRGYGWDKNPWVWVIEWKQLPEKK